MLNDSNQEDQQQGCQRPAAPEWLMQGGSCYPGLCA